MPPSRSKRAASGKKPATTSGISKVLGDLVKSKSATFACGGSIPVVRECVDQSAHDV
ncbi:hypothetical protein ACRE_042980 [Hapsidospora chrysogenum ATCC 11550]|uniref:Uncharacterized protein n=1 Tax=Hapsidospora chrysogenum (strain ATCC 11550 / CBS 779.69 / DSM 880 / IAM 14645 / JCM 23072 / IMI 49137) TaxID=857340 RepID=A0A086T675_HAPC1|nr:hypothetical protein ACRE_042980 [Hapsidospora chrysogenum ATCC 11550]